MNFARKRKNTEWEVLDDERQLSYFCSLLEMVSNESLLHSMNKLVEAEDYEIAILYRNELMRRGKLKPEASAIPGPCEITY